MLEVEVKDERAARLARSHQQRPPVKVHHLHTHTHTHTQPQPQTPPQTPPQTHTRIGSFVRMCTFELVKQAN
jgi:hypothetical protein